MNKMHPGGCWKLQSGLLYPLVKGRREGIEREDGRCVVLPHLAFFAMVLLQQRGAGVRERLSAVAARLPACLPRGAHSPLHSAAGSVEPLERSGGWGRRRALIARPLISLLL